MAGADANSKLLLAASSVNRRASTWGTTHQQPCLKNGPRQPLSALEQPTALRWFARMCSRTSVANQCCSTTFELTIWKAPKMEVPPKSSQIRPLKQIETSWNLWWLGDPFQKPIGLWSNSQWTHYGPRHWSVSSWPCRAQSQPEKLRHCSDPSRLGNHVTHRDTDCICIPLYHITPSHIIKL